MGQAGVEPNERYEAARQAWKNILEEIRLPQTATDQFERVHNLLSVAPQSVIQNVQDILGTWDNNYHGTGRYDMMVDLPLLLDIHAVGGWSIDPTHPLHQKS